jgi:hypothetical protein
VQLRLREKELVEAGPRKIHPRFFKEDTSFITCPKTYQFRKKPSVSTLTPDTIQPSGSM